MARTLTLSIGYACLNGRNPPLEVMERADRALYYAKDNGRNQVQEFERLLAQGRLENVLRDGGVELF
jgi:PleD family two-component response regulator